MLSRTSVRCALYGRQWLCGSGRVQATRPFSSFPSDEGPRTVQALLERKYGGTHVFSVDVNETVFQATKLMVDNHIGSLAVTRNGRMIGIVTERDYLRKIVHEGRTSHETSVEAISTLGSEVVVATPSDYVQDCLEIMLTYNVRHLPVVSGDARCIGMLSMRDLAGSLTQQTDVLANDIKEFIVENMTENVPRISTRRWR